jgi:hypothetical protein
MENPTPTTTYMAIGQSWCGYSVKQQTALQEDCANHNGKWDADAKICTIGDKEVGIVMCDKETSDICTTVDGHIQAYPTWVKKEGNQVSPLVTQNGGSVHYVQTIGELGMN